jgi:photosystem II stability/assembly factor-like uncharacterized protein
VLGTNFCDNRFMRLLPLLLLASTAFAQGPRIQLSHTTEDLRGVSAVSREVAWSSGTHGTYLHTTDAGRTWYPAHVPDAANLDFRAVVAFSPDEAFLMSAGPGDQSRIYHTSDAGEHWQLEFTNTNPKGFFDSMVFWDPKHGIVLGDPIPDESAKSDSAQESKTDSTKNESGIHFEVLITDDGQTWHQIPPSQLPPAINGEGAFAASNSCIAILRTPEAGSGDATKGKGATFSRAASSVQNIATSAAEGDPNIWFATGGKGARVFHSADRGQTWQVFDTPIVHGSDSMGIFSIAFRDSLHGVIAGGDYKHPKEDGPNLAFTEDGGKTWTLSDLRPQAYFSAVAYDYRVIQEAARDQAEEASEEKEGKKIRIKPVPPQRLFIIDPEFIFDFRPPLNPRRINGKKKQGYGFNAVSPYPEGGALVVGPKGTIAFIP